MRTSETPLSNRQNLPKEFKEILSRFAEATHCRQELCLGYPCAQDFHMNNFYRWLIDENLDYITIVNVGSPYKPPQNHSCSDAIETKVVDFFADLYNFSVPHWGFVTNAGTDGNMHGIYFGRKFLAVQSPLPPIIYVSQEAHYSVKKVADVQNTEIRIIPASPLGEMLPDAFAEAFDPTRPALVVFAVGGTFKGAIDQQAAINEIIDKKNPVAVYRHIDAALFGGYLPFLNSAEAHKILDQSLQGYDSIAVSAHKFFSLSEPSGIFICKKSTYDSLHAKEIPYLNNAMPTISCTRSGLTPIKFFWRIATVKQEGFKKQAREIMEVADYFFHGLEELGVPVWRNPYSNTLFFRQPSAEISERYSLANNTDPVLGSLSHVVVMQHVSKALVDRFLGDFRAELIAQGKL